MTPAFVILLAWLVFGGTHLSLSASGLRSQTPAHWGPNAFTLIYTAITVLTISGLIASVWIYGDKGVSGPDLGRFTLARYVLGAVAGVGCLLAIAGLLNYPRSPMAVLATRQRQKLLDHRPLKPPSSVERICRHPFFAGLILMMGAHALLASTLAGTVYFGGFVVMAGIGIPLQDRKLLKRWRETYGDFQKTTSIVPLTRKSTTANTDISQIQWGLWISALFLSVIIFGLLHWIWTFANGASFAIFITVFGLSGVLTAIVSGKMKTKSE